jgi:UDP-N-acetylmuramoyl-tripeptide--D-alanyl-D-alanine ligase
LKGEKFDGHKFISSISKKVCGLVVEKLDPDIEISQWVVPNTTEALGHIARANRDKFTGCLIAITGSCGKTSVKEMVASILEKSGPVSFTKGNSNNEIGVPSTLINISDDHKYSVVEMGAKGFGDIAYLCKIARPNIALINNVMPAHLESFGDIQSIAKAKGEIYQNLTNKEVAVINLDEPHAKVWIKSTKAKVVTFSTVKSEADINAQNIILENNGCYSFILDSPQGKIPVNMPLRGRHNVANAIAAAACAFSAGVDLQIIKYGLSSLRQVRGRMEFSKLCSGTTLIDDTYNASPGSVMAAIDSLVEANGLHILILADMAELGRDAIRLHRDIGRYASAAGVNIFLTLGPLSLYAAEEFGEKSQHFNDKKELLDFLTKSKIFHDNFSDDEKVILIKGSRFMGMEDISESIKNWGAP